MMEWYSGCGLLTSFMQWSCWTFLSTCSSFLKSSTSSLFCPLLPLLNLFLANSRWLKGLNILSTLADPPRPSFPLISKGNASSLPKCVCLFNPFSSSTALVSTSCWAFRKALRRSELISFGTDVGVNGNKRSLIPSSRRGLSTSNRPIVRSTIYSLGAALHLCSFLSFKQRDISWMSGSE